MLFFKYIKGFVTNNRKYFQKIIVILFCLIIEHITIINELNLQIMIHFKILSFFVLTLFLASSVQAKDTQPNKQEIKQEIVQKSQVQTVTGLNEKQDKNEKQNSEKPSFLLYVLAFLIPPLAVGIYTKWKMPTLWNVIWTWLGYFPGVIHAFIIFSRK